MTILVEDFGQNDRFSELSEILRTPAHFLTEVLSSDKTFPVKLFVEPGQWALPFFEARDFTQQYAGYQPFFVMDDIIDYSEYQKQIPNQIADTIYGEKLTPIAVVNCKNLDEWIDRINVKPPYKRGVKFQRLNDTYQSSTLDEMLSKLSESFKHKQEKYPDFCPTSYHVLDAVFNHPTWVIHTVSEEDGWVSTMAGFIYNDTFYVPYIDLTDDEALRKRHRCYVIGHIKAAQLAARLGLKKADFGIYLPYKDLLAFDREFKAGIRYTKPRALEDDYLQVKGASDYKPQV